MSANYHTHTKRCHHASGTDREYVEAAIKAGFTELGFSDHIPFFKDNGEPEDGFRVQTSEIPEYFGSLYALREEYKDKIKIHIGFESEYYPNAFAKNLEKFGDYQPEFLILGQHYYDEFQKGYSFDETADEEELDRYIFSVIEGIRTGKFLYVAHPDVKWFTGDKKFYEKRIFELCYAAADRDVPLEFNLLGFVGKRHYPNDVFLKTAARLGNKMVIGMDAHAPSHLLNLTAAAEARAKLGEFGITPLESLKIVK